MSIRLGDAIVYFKGDKSQLEKDTDSAAKSTKGSFLSLGGSLKTILGGALLSGVGAAVAGIGALGVAAVGVANDFQAAKNTIRTQLGDIGGDTEKYGEIAKQVFANNFAGSINEAAQTLAEVKKQLAGLDDKDLQAATENAFKFSDAFGEDMSKTISTVNTLMQKFGLTQAQAFDFLTSGMQRGLNSSGDFLDSIGEYSNLFAEGGADAAQFFSFMETGLQGGALGTDKAADAFKEFQIRLLDGSDSTREALAAIGIDAEEMAAQIESGQLTVVDAFGMVQGKLGELDTVAQNQVGVALIGTQFEDMGMKAIAGIDATKTALGDLAGATAGLDEQYNTLGARFETLQRQAMVALEPIGAQLLGIVETAMPTLQSFVEWISTIALPWVTELFSQMGTLFTESGIVEAFEGYRAIFQTVFTDIAEALGLTTGNFSALEAILWVIEKVFKAVAVQIQLAGVIMYGMGEAIDFIIAKVQQVLTHFKNLQAFFGQFTVPEALQQHSPPPLAQALTAVKEGLDSVRNTQLPGLIDPAKQAAGGAGQPQAAAGGNQTINLVVDGQVLAQVVNQHLGGLAAAGV